MVARPVGGSSTRTVNEPVGSFLVRSGTGGFGGPVGYHPGAGAERVGAATWAPSTVAAEAVAANSTAAQYLMAAAQRGGGEMGGYGNFGGGPRIGRRAT